jgi:hypothetical protein
LLIVFSGKHKNKPFRNKNRDAKVKLHTSQIILILQEKADFNQTQQGNLRKKTQIPPRGIFQKIKLPEKE